MRKTIAGIVFCLVFLNVQAQNIQRPKLVVGIMVDQMRWDFLYRYYGRYGNDGFKRLMREGFNIVRILSFHILPLILQQAIPVFIQGVFLL